jgi:hypothetical protein
MHPEVGEFVNEEVVVGDGNELGVLRFRPEVFPLNDDAFEPAIVISRCSFGTSGLEVVGLI